MHPQTEIFMQLFEGYADAYGVCNYTGTVSSGGKAECKVATKKSRVTTDLWDKHLMGRQGLGVVPINEKSMVKFGAIDVDDYPTCQPHATAKLIATHKMPLVMTRTKSGGIHLWCMTTEWCDASVMVKKLNEMAAVLGFGHCEIFPKQTRILTERGDLGSWINMPYFNARDSDRFGYHVIHGTKIPIEAFIAQCRDMLITPEALAAMIFEIEEVLREGPPCLCHLCKDGFPQGTRNNGLLNLGIYCKKAFPDNWEQKLSELNDKVMTPPLTPQEVVGTINSLKKKEYNYTCKSQPIAPFCNAVKCRTREFGVGGGDIGMPKLGSLTKIETTPPLWFIEVEGEPPRRLELTTEELQNPVMFQRKAMAELNVMPIAPKRADWAMIVQKLLSSVSIVPVAEEMTAKGQLRALVRDFCTSRVSARSHEELLLGKPWTDGGRTYFRFQDLIAFLARCKFNALAGNQIAAYLRDWGADKKFFNIRGKGCTTTHLPEFTDKQTESFSTPTYDKPEPFS